MTRTLEEQEAGGRERGQGLVAKRVTDIALSLIGLVLLSPVLALISVWIKTDSKGPIFYMQERVGLNGAPFRIIKFRTMVVDADTRGPSVTKGGDPRITALGRFLRKYKLDELPQLINVVRGDMSLVGPRPEVARYVAHWSEADKRAILSVRPGITDNAAIAFMDEEAILAEADDTETAYITTVMPQKLRLYHQYINERSFWMDTGIMLKTVMKIFHR